MTKNEMISNYRKFSAADRYIIGFNYNGTLYMTETADLQENFLYMEKSSAKNGGGYSLRLRLKKADKAQLISAGAVSIGSAEMLKDSKYNRGETFERLVTEKKGMEWKKDNLPFWLGGDIEQNGIKYQIKFDSATIATESGIKKQIKRFLLDL